MRSHRPLSFSRKKCGTSRETTSGRQMGNGDRILCAAGVVFLVYIATCRSGGKERLDGVGRCGGVQVENAEKRG